MSTRGRRERASDAQSLGLLQLLDRLQGAAHDQSRISIGDMLEAIGRRSFGPMLLVPGLTMIVGIPGLASICGIIAAIFSIQLLFGRNRFWVPHWTLRLSLSSHHFQRGLHFLHPAARFIDRFTRPRLKALVHGRGVPAIATMCAMMGLVVPAVEVIPMADSVVGAGLVIFGIALIAEDGLLALIAVLFYFAALGLASMGTLGIITGGSFFGNLL